MNQLLTYKKSFKIAQTKGLVLLSALLLPFCVSADNHYSSWSDKTICRLLKADEGNAEYRTEAVSRGLDCVEPMHDSDQKPKRPIDELIDSGKITLLSSSDVSQKHISNTKKWMNVAVRTWLSKETEASSYYYPIVITLVGKSESAANELEGRLCEEIKTNAYASRLCG